jgi:hypothetical protein
MAKWKVSNVTSVNFPGVDDELSPNFGDGRDQAAAV